MIKARRCERCGGILTNEKAIRSGYGPCCLRKLREEEVQREIMKEQCSLFDEAGADGIYHVRSKNEASK